MKRFENQVAVISGAASGLGYAIAERIGSEGGKLAILDVNQPLLTRAVESLHAKGVQAKGFTADISSEAEVKATIQSTQTEYGKIDIMVNAAGIIGPTNTKITEYPAEAYDKIYAVNLKGSFLMTKYVLMAMEPANYGRILLIASIAGKEGNPFMVGYSSMKAGVIGIVKAVGKEYAQTGITVNGLAPAVIRTSMNEQTAPEQLAYMTSKIPMGRLGTVEEVASIAAWIVSAEASFNTGFVFDLSGGRATY